MIWTPKTPMNPEAIERMKSTFPRPEKPWMEWDEPNDLLVHAEWVSDTHPENDPQKLIDALEDLGSGLGSSCYDGWEEWFDFLLPRALEHCGTNTLLERCVSGFMDRHWSDIHEHYSGFRQDVFQTLGCALMDPRFWPIDVKRWSVDNPQFSAQIFFGLKYCPDQKLNTWIDSLTRISDPAWLASLLCWSAATWPVLSKEDMTASFLARCLPHVDWAGSYMLGSGDRDAYGFIPWSRRKSFITYFNKLAVKQSDQWIEVASSVPRLSEKLKEYGVLDQFIDNVI